MIVYKEISADAEIFILTSPGYFLSDEISCVKAKALKRCLRQLLRFYKHRQRYLLGNRRRIKDAQETSCNPVSYTHLFEKKGAPYRPFNDCLNRKHCFHYGDICLACERHKNRNKCSACGHCTDVYKRQNVFTATF